MTRPSSPTALRRQLAAELRRLRDAAQRTVADVAGQLGWSDSKLSRIETAHTGIRSMDLDRLLAAYSAPENIRRRLRAMATQARQRGWWEAYGDVLPNAYETYIGLEADAKAAREFNGAVVPGLLQTDEYAHAVIKADAASDDPGLVSQRVAVRMARTAVLAREPPLELRAIVDEAVLHRPVGGPDVLRRQLVWLVEVSKRSSVTVQVLPFAVGAHRGISGSFTILDFPDRADLSVVYCDGMTGGVFRNRPGEVQVYEDAFSSLQLVALDASESRRFISATLRGSHS